MHVAIVAPEFPPDLGGVETYAAEFAKELASRGHRVTVFTRRRPESPVQLAGLEVRATLVGRYAADLRELRSIHVDAWHVMNAAYAWVALHYGPTVVSVYGNDFLRPYIGVGEPDLSHVPFLWRAGKLRRGIERAVGVWRTPGLMRAGLDRATRILACSRYTERVFLEHFPRCRGRTAAAMVGVSADFFGAGNPRSNSDVKRLITVCRLADRRKNVDLVLRALARLKERYRFSYTVVGDGALRTEFESLAEALGLGERVTFTGVLSTQEMRDRLAGSDLFVLPSSINPGSHEGFGIAYLEANACGTPTLAAKLAGAAEAVDEGVSGYFTPSLTEEGLAGALERFLSGGIRFDPDVCRSFARTFAWANVVDEAIPWYGKQASPAGRPVLAVPS